MPFRNDEDATADRIRALRQQLSSVKSQLQSNSALQDRAGALTREIEVLERDARKRASLPLLRRVRVASPCHENWNDMSGDERTRFCGRCEKSVFNLSGMTAADAEELLVQHGTSLCVRFYRRADGTVMTADCPVGRTHVRKQRIVAAALAGGVAAVTSGLAMAAALSMTSTPPCATPPAAIVEQANPEIGKVAPEPDTQVVMGDVALEPELGEVALPDIRGSVEFAQEPE